MPQRPWMKWYPADLRAEPSLRMCSRAARSLWVDMLGLMHEAEPYGHLVVNGKDMTPEELARVLGDSVKDIRKWLKELEENRVLSITEEGTIYSRRMVRDHEKAEKGRADIGKRWRSEPNSYPNRVPNREGGETPNRVPIPKNLVLPITPEARSHIPDIKPDRSETGAARPVPDPTPGSAMDAVRAFAAARTKFFPDRKELDPAARKARWQQKVFAHAKACLTDAEYQRLVTEAANDTPEGQAWMNRLSDEMRAIEAERERRTAT